jgi:hypothetical protein
MFRMMFRGRAADNVRQGGSQHFMAVSRKHIFSGVLIAAALAGAALADVLDTPVEKGNVSIQFPKGWSSNTKVKGGALISAMSPKRDKDGTGEFQASFLLSTEVGTKVEGPAQQARVSSEFPDYKVVEEPVPVTVNGLVGTNFGGTFTNRKVELRFRQYIFVHDSQLYLITFTCLNSQWAAYQPQVEASVATFRIK